MSKKASETKDKSKDDFVLILPESCGKSSIIQHWLSEGSVRLIPDKQYEAEHGKIERGSYPTKIKSYPLKMRIAYK